MNHSSRWISVGLLYMVGLTSTLVGCGSPSSTGEKKLVYSATGSLQINGQPGADAWVTLAPDFDGVPVPLTRVGADGKFTLNVYDSDVKAFQPPGDPVGDYHVLVRLPRDPASPMSKDRLGGAYFDPQTFKHPISIELGENTIAPIKIENAKFVD